MKQREILAISGIIAFLLSVAVFFGGLSDTETPFTANQIDWLTVKVFVSTFLVLVAVFNILNIVGVVVDNARANKDVRRRLSGTETN